MRGSTPQHYTIADFLKWDDDKELILNPKFQRGPVWPSPARSYLIDSILRGYPIPKLLLRTTVDRDTRRTIRDVVDGQQRLRAIIDFASGKFALGPKAGDLKGLRYANLDDDLKDSFLEYKLTCEQLINATDEDVLEVFVRINSYAIPVNEAELRNARFDNDFSALVKSIVRRVKPLWDLGVISNRDRVRMSDQSFVAEILGFWLEGVTDGGEPRITRLYETCKESTPDELPVEDEVVAILLEAAGLLEDFAKEPIVQRPHSLMIIAALMYVHKKLPAGRLSFDKVPEPGKLLTSKEKAVESLGALNVVLGSPAEDVSGFVALVESKTSTQRIRSRQIRFEYFCRALAGQYAE
ncbi:DUF262 domain-containing protein [Streptomyces sp. NPDC102270]|uniref:GmrSD restriction endonuclease domain-containing protein n=1 Tax=Streptomyces sp. NPDC102270 TaxID=3366150 RepID=UPI003818A19F